MDFGVLMFMTDYAISAPALAQALEERGFESLWVPEHSHIPLSRKTPFPGGGELPKQYYDAMREIWTKSKPEYHGETVDFPPMMTWPKPVQNPLPVIVGGAFPHAARRAVRYGNGWAPIAGRAPYGDIDDYLPKFKAMLSEAGRKFEDVPITLMGAGEDV